MAVLVGAALFAADEVILVAGVDPRVDGNRAAAMLDRMPFVDGLLLRLLGLVVIVTGVAVIAVAVARLSAAWHPGKILVASEPRSGKRYLTERERRVIDEATT